MAWPSRTSKLESWSPTYRRDEESWPCSRQNASCIHWYRPSSRRLHARRHLRVTIRRCPRPPAPPSPPDPNATPWPAVGPDPDFTIACCIVLQVAISNSLVCIAHAKLDLEDRLNKRRQQQKRKDEIADVILRKLCAALQLAAFSPQMMTGCSSVRAPASADCPAHRDRGKKDFDEQAAGAHDATRASRRLDNSTKVRRRHGARAEVSYSDAEIKSLLKSLD